MHTIVTENERVGITYYLNGTAPPSSADSVARITRTKIFGDPTILAKYLSNLLWQELCKWGQARAEAEGEPLSIEELDEMKQKKAVTKANLQEHFDDIEKLKTHARNCLSDINNIITKRQELEKKTSAKNKKQEDRNSGEKWGDWATQNTDRLEKEMEVREAEEEKVKVAREGEADKAKNMKWEDDKAKIPRDEKADKEAKIEEWAKVLGE